MKSFDSPLELEYIDGRNWKLTSNFDYLATDELIQIPSGFITDFASIPRLLWNLLPPTGDYGKAAVVHDWLYRHGGRIVHATAPNGEITYRIYSRSACDGIFLQAMEDLGVGWFKRKIMWLAVRNWGWISFKPA